MAWNPAVPATNAALLSLPIRENFQALETTVYAPLNSVADGTLLYRAAGPTLAGESMLVYDPTNNNLKLFGGTIGTSGQGVLALGASTIPTTSPVDTLQFYTEDFGAEAGSRSLTIRDERGGRTTIGSGLSGLYFSQVTGSMTLRLVAGSTAAQIGTASNHPLGLIQSGVERLRLTIAGNAEFFAGTTGTTGAGVLALGPGTAPTTSPVDTVQLYTEDWDTGSQGLSIRDERGTVHKHSTNSSSTGLLRISRPAGVNAEMWANANLEVRVGSGSNHPLHLMTNAATRAVLDTSSNFILNSLSGVGTSGTGVLALGPGTAPTTSPVDTVQLYTADVNAEAGSRALFLRDERGGITGLGSSTTKTGLTIVNPAGSATSEFAITSDGSLQVGTRTGNNVNFYTNNILRSYLDTVGFQTWTTAGTQVQIAPEANTAALRVFPAGGHNVSFYSASAGSPLPGMIGIWDYYSGLSMLHFLADNRFYVRVLDASPRMLWAGNPDSGGVGWRMAIFPN
jgi:hypothetical protein